MFDVRSGRQRGAVRGALLVALVIVQFVVIAYLLVGGGDAVRKEAKIQAMSAVGNAAVKVMENRRPAAGGADTHGSAVDLIHNPIEVKSLAENIYYATGVANVYLIASPEGNVVFDTGLSIQAAEQLLALREVMPDAPVTHVVVSHSHQDHAGGARIWLEEGTELVTHREFNEEMRYLKELEPYLHRRNRVLFPWIPEEIPELGLLNYGGLEPTVLVDEGAEYRFTIGATDFVVLSTPGAEGADNVSLWLPQQKILFSGDFFGPQFPQFPNVFTMRGEKIRKPVEYIRSLEKIIALQPEVIAPAHFSPTTGSEDILAKLVLTHDAVAYVHEQTVAGMNAGKTVHELMRDIQLPPELDLPQNHGKVSWAVKSIWEYYATWFHYDSTTELYSHPVREVYPYLAEAAGSEILLTGARDYLDAQQPVHALHLLEMALAGDPGNVQALELRLDSLNRLKREAQATTRNDYEIYWLASRINDTEQRLGRPTGTVGGFDTVDIPAAITGTGND